MEGVLRGLVIGKPIDFGGLVSCTRHMLRHPADLADTAVRASALS